MWSLLTKSPKTNVMYKWIIGAHVVHTVMVYVELSLMVLYSSDLHLFPHQGYGVVSQSGLSKKIEVNELQHPFL
jgi:hypothetical protein